MNFCFTRNNKNSLFINHHNKKRDNEMKNKIKNTTQGPKATLSKKTKENPEEKNGKGLLYINNKKNK